MYIADFKFDLIWFDLIWLDLATHFLHICLQ